MNGGMTNPASEPRENGRPPAAGDPAGRAGIVAVVGRANVGKSSLINALVGEKVSVVSPVAQTTRHRIRAILNDRRGQVVLLDTPGVHRAESDLGRLMNRAARKAAEGTDLVLLLLDGSAAPRIEDEGWLRRLCSGREGMEAWMIALTKSDLGAPCEAAYRALLSRVRAAEPDAGSRPEPEWIRVSAATGDGLERLLDRVFDRLPVHPPLFPDDVVTDFPRRLFMADVVREKLFLRLREELPHRVAVWIEDLEETPEGWSVAAVVYVERSSQQGIVVGYKGRQIRAVRRAAEAELGAIYGHPVRVGLVVKVEKNWTKNYWFLKKTGLDL